MLLTRIAGPTVFPDLLAAAKEHLREDSTDQDLLISGLIAAAVEMIGAMAGRVLFAETWTLAISGVTGDLVLPKSPVTAVTAISYYDAAGVSQAATVADFYLFKDADVATLRPKPGKAWPVAQDREDAISVSFTAGYAALPGALKAAMLLLIGHLYENRETVVVGMAPAEVPLAVHELVAVHRLGWVAG